MNKIKIYGKPNCVFCVRAKDLCEKESLDYEYFSIGRDMTVDEIKEQFPGATTVPIITVNGVWIGGFSELNSMYRDGEFLNG